MTNRYAIVEAGVVANVILWDGSSPLVGVAPPVRIPEGVTAMPGHTYADGVFLPPEPEQPAPPSVADIIAAIQTFMDDKARALGYDNLTTAVTYAEEPAVSKFQAEGAALRAWRSLVWQAGYAYLADVESGVKPMPTIQEAISLLPVLELPA